MTQEEYLVEAIWKCPWCKQMAAGPYRGPRSVEAAFDWAQKGHDQISPGCPYRFQWIKFHRLPDEPEFDVTEWDPDND